VESVYAALMSLLLKVAIVDGKLQVRARRNALEKMKRVRPMAAYSPAVKTNVLIIGGGQWHSSLYHHNYSSVQYVPGTNISRCILCLSLLEFLCPIWTPGL